MDQDFSWQIVLRASPSRVFCSLVRAASTAGRVCGVEDYGTVLTFSPSRRPRDLGGCLRVVVAPCDVGSMVTITEAFPRTTHPRALVLQAQSVAMLIGQLRRHYDEHAV